LPYLTRGLRLSEPKVNETKPSETKPKKMVRRSIAIALGIICIILIAGLGWAMAYYTMIVNNKNNTISSLSTSNSQLTTNNTNLQLWLNGNITLLEETQSWLQGNITAYNAYVADHPNEQIANLENYVSSLNADITSLYAKITNLTSIINLGDSTVWVDDATVSQGASSYSTWTESASYDGYVSVLVFNSTVSSAWVEVIYSAYGVSFDQTQVISTVNNLNSTFHPIPSASFPLLPCSDITVGVGNGNTLGSANETVSIIYTY
jgi:hypothetical protein